MSFFIKTKLPSLPQSQLQFHSLCFRYQVELVSLLLSRRDSGLLAALRRSTTKKCLDEGIVPSNTTTFYLLFLFNSGELTDSMDWHENSMSNICVIYIGVLHTYIDYSAWLWYCLCRKGMKRLKEVKRILNKSPSSLFSDRFYKVVTGFW